MDTPRKPIKIMSVGQVEQVFKTREEREADAHRLGLLFDEIQPGSDAAE